MSSVRPGLAQQPSPQPQSRERSAGDAGAVGYAIRGVGAFQLIDPPLQVIL